MRRDEDAFSLRFEGQNMVDHTNLIAKVETCRGLIHNEEGTFLTERSRNQDELLFPTTQLRIGAKG